MDFDPLCSPYVGSIMGWRKYCIWWGSIRSSASLSVMSFSFTIDTATQTAARAVRFAVKLCRRNNTPFSMVNSISWWINR